MWNDPKPVWRTARKEHECAGDDCARAIEVGARYLDQALMSPQHAHLRYCEECGIAVLEAEESREYYLGGGRSTDWSDRYLKHVVSAKWRRFKDDIIKQRGNRCEHCGQSGSLQLHHLTYERTGNELPDDVELLCHDCHDKADKTRAMENARIRFGPCS